jgi:hypothetical protein
MLTPLRPKVIFSSAEWTGGLGCSSIWWRRSKMRVRNLIVFCI